MKTLGFFWVLLASSSFAAQQTYEVKHLPALGNCHELAHSLAARFQSDTGLATRGRCTNISKEGFDVQIQYEAEKEIRIHSTIPRWGSITSFGAYLTVEECNAALPNWVQQFRSETQLEPLFSFCFKEPYPFGSVKDRNWQIRIDAVGEPAKRVFADSDLLFGQPVGYTSETFEQTLRQRLEAQNYSVALTKFEYRAASYELSMVYYAAPLDRVSVQKAAEFRGRSDCLAELKGSLEVVATSTARPVMTFCTQGHLGHSELFAVYGGAELSTELSAESFADYAECAAHKAELVELYAGLGFQTVGGFCTQDGKEYRVRLINKSAE